MIYLPEDILKDILSRLPAKSILRFRSVSKSWFSLISSTDFVRLQLKRAFHMPFHQIIIGDICNKHLTSVDCYTSKSFDDLSTSRSLKLPFYRGSNSKTRFLGSSNGLVCVSTSSYIYDRIHLWNPCTNEYKRIPTLKELKKGADVDRCGFGYDSSSNDFKFLIVTRRERGAMINIFSLRRGAWRCIPDLKYAEKRCVESHGSGDICPARICGVFVNHALHWTYIDDAESEDSHWILSFCLTNETFNKFPLPFPLAFFHNDCIGVLGGFLCISVGTPIFDVRYDIWMMKGYGVNSSWTKLTNRWLCYGGHDAKNSSPLCFSRQGEIILQKVRGDSVSFNIETKYFTGKYIDAVVYVETLISPNKLNESEQRNEIELRV